MLLSWEMRAAQKEETKRVHCFTYRYIESAISDLQSSSSSYARTWFGTTSADFLIEKFKVMERLLRSDTITYVHGGNKCKSNTVAYPWKGTRTIYLCGLYERFPYLSGYDSKTSTIVHELAHALAYIDDKAYGPDSCKNLAKSAPHLAANNADNYCYFVSTLTSRISPLRMSLLLMCAF